MSQTLSAKQLNIINQPVDFVRSHFSQIAHKDLIEALNDGAAPGHSKQTSSQGSQNPISSQNSFSAILERELGIEGSLDLRTASIPRLNDCKTPEEIRALHHKLVRFDCMIQD